MDYIKKGILVFFILFGSKIIRFIPKKLELVFSNPIIKIIAVTLLFYYYIEPNWIMSFILSTLLILILSKFTEYQVMEEFKPKSID